MSVLFTISRQGGEAMPADETRPVQRFAVSTADEAEAEDFIRRVYVGNRTRFHGAADGARFVIAVAEADGIAADHVRSTVDCSAVTDPLGYFFSLAPYHGRVRLRSGREETIVLPGEACLYPLGVPLDLSLADLGVRSVRLPWARLAAVAAETAGIAAADLRFEAATPVTATRGRQWSAFVELASGLLLAEDSIAAQPLVTAELART